MRDKKTNQAILRTFNSFETKKINERYISELDLMIYLLLSSILYITLIFISTNFILFNNYWITLIFLLIIFYFLYINLAYLIYDIAPLKNKWKNKIINEDGKTITKRMKFQFISFMVIAYMFGTSRSYIKFFYILILLYILVVLIKIYFLYKKEKREISL